MTRRLFAGDLEPTTGLLTLEGDELHHIRNVLRARPGTIVELFNGRGLRVQAEIVDLGRRSASLAIQGEPSLSPTPFPWTLAVALPKGDRANWLVEKCTELDVGRLAPLATSRAVVTATANKQDRLRRGVIEACKQCGRDWLMEIDEPRALGDLFSLTVAESNAGWLLDPEGVEISSIGDSRPSVVAVGPEGGWSDEELAAADEHGWKRVRIARHVLRIETAALAAASWISAGQF
ncbi:Ribosomal RNA small subunit methyltransferase E [Planctomycetes bacterium Pan216]|uniref:Ribosomal RNA small subunit methyltransferase E n=1 Tax=Kolteria novifilia TaxID=2527975 RepID=A0A518B9Q1_9BACT|nr:Ribosomal RNA small subunit methyltransferase E [Planctomycetes bacterium Pan216]